MTNRSSAPNIIIPPTSQVYMMLNRLVDNQRIVFLTGLPGVGKSLLLNQLAHLAHFSGHQVYLLQWDILRDAFMTDRIASLFPDTDGITHSVIRRAAGLWVRQAVAQWHQKHLGEKSILIGEAPLIGNRLLELVLPRNDAAESILLEKST
nr:ATP-binding protein [Dehalococcoidia bacterium]